MNKETDEMQIDVRNALTFALMDEKLQYIPDFDKPITEYLQKQGYGKVEDHKKQSVWHKVADGDLPEYGRHVLGIMAESNVPTVCSLKKFGHSKIYADLWDMQIDDDNYHGLNEIIAWTEIPEYKE